ncbi:MAG: hypothetical protein D6822_02830 [Cyanobacteria bacterium J149]|nr:MAG: hypothetical protein D6822_02830 [Cyanobacteria bacterium J149]
MSFDEKLCKRILNGAVWLITHSYGWCQQYGKVYDPKKYVAHLHLYERLVDKAKEKGMSEEKCLQITSGLKVSEMSEDLILVYLCESNLKSRNKSNTVSKLYKKFEEGYANNHRYRQSC